MYDIFFISYDELNANQNWDILKSRFPKAKRVHGIKGINNAHAECASQSMTKMFWTVDADTVVDNNFMFDYAVMPWDTKYLHVWYSRNPVNGLTYGYGAIKLWPISAAKNKNQHWLDFTTSAGKIKILDDVVSTTCFNTDSYSAWKSGFRESVKLATDVYNNNSQESLERLLVWINVKNQVPYALDTVFGVRDGINFVKTVNFDINSLKLINNFDWLFDQFNHLSATVRTVDSMNADELKNMIGFKNA